MTKGSNFNLILKTFVPFYSWPLTKSKEPGKNIWISLEMSQGVMNKRPFSCPLHSLPQQKGLEAKFPKFICAISFQCLILVFSAGWWQRHKMEHFFPSVILGPELKRIFLPALFASLVVLLFCGQRTIQICFSCFYAASLTDVAKGNRRQKNKENECVETCSYDETMCCYSHRCETPVCALPDKSPYRHSNTWYFQIALI